MPYPSRLFRGFAPLLAERCFRAAAETTTPASSPMAMAPTERSAPMAGLMLSLGNTDASLGLSVDGEPTGLVGGGSLDDAACAMNSRKADQIPLDMYLMLDSSGSMTDFIADGKTTKWAAVQKALVAFVNDPDSAGLGVGLQYFPLTQPGAPEVCFASSECGTGGQVRTLWCPTHLLRDTHSLSGSVRLPAW